jgi:hypothetical protein
MAGIIKYHSHEKWVSTLYVDPQDLGEIYGIFICHIAYKQIVDDIYRLYMVILFGQANKSNPIKKVEHIL